MFPRLLAQVAGNHYKHTAAAADVRVNLYHIRGGTIMNRVELSGRLTSDPRENNGAVKWTLAVDRRYVGKDGVRGADFIPCVAFGKTMEFVQKYLKKGTKIIMSGRILTGKFTNDKNEEVYTTEVVAEDIEFAESKKASQGGQDQSQGYQQGQGYQQAPPQGQNFQQGPQRGQGYQQGQNFQQGPQQGQGYQQAPPQGQNFQQGQGYPQTSPQGFPQNQGGFGAADGFMDLPNGIDEQLPFA